MAIATSTALAVGGLAVSAASTTASFIQAGKQKKLQRQAEADAQAAMDEARKKLEINVYDAMGVKKEPYELQREALLSQGAQAIEAGQETGRGAAVTAGKVQMAQNEAEQGIRTEMGKEMTDIEKLQLGEESRLRDIGVQLDTEEAAGAQQAAAEAQKAAAQSTAQGFQGLTSTLSQGLQMVPLFSQDLGAQKAALSKMNMSSEDFQKFGNVGGKTMGAAGTGGFTNLDFEKIGSMSNADFRQFKKDLTPQQRQMLFQNQQYMNNYNPFNPFQ